MRKYNRLIAESADLLARELWAHFRDQIGGVQIPLGVRKFIRP